MPPKVDSLIIEEIYQAVAALPGGASLEQIETALRVPPPRRTLQRRLATLVAEGRLVLEGVRRGARYFVPAPKAGGATHLFPEVTPLHPPETGTSIAERTETGEEGITLTETARQLRQKVRLPLQQRTPVGYRRAFLDEYQPNVTAYLPLELRRHLTQLGQFQSGDAPAGTYARQLYDRLLIDLSWNSSRLEGNTYSMLETERLLAIGASAEGKSYRDTQMILNHKAAIEMLVENAAEIGFNRYTVLNLHGLLSDNLLDDPQASGSLREGVVGISGTVYHPPDVPQLINECFNQILATASAIADPLEQAFFAMVHLPYLQPFQDVNKRVSRLAANIPLIRFNLCPLSFVDVPQRDYVDGMLAIYELNRIELLREVFAWAYQRSCERYAAVRQVLGEPDRFRLRYREEMKTVIGEIIRTPMNQPAATKHISHYAQQLDAADRTRFVEVVETELLSLHEGNFMRYRVRPSEFEAWRKNWR